MNSFARLHLQCYATKSLFHTLLQPLLHEAAQSHQAQSGITVQTVQLSRNSLKSSVDCGCVRIPALEPTTTPPPPPRLTVVPADIFKRLMVMKGISKQSVKFLLSPLAGAFIRHHHHKAQ